MRKKENAKNKIKNKKIGKQKIYTYCGRNSNSDVFCLYEHSLVFPDKFRHSSLNMEKVTLETFIRNERGQHVLQIVVVPTKMRDIAETGISYETLICCIYLYALAVCNRFLMLIHRTSLPEPQGSLFVRKFPV